jgi:hypothetical protein
MHMHMKDVNEDDNYTICAGSVSVMRHNKSNVIKDAGMGLG